MELYRDELKQKLKKGDTNLFSIDNQQKPKVNPSEPRTISDERNKKLKGLADLMCPNDKESAEVLLRDLIKNTEADSDESISNLCE